MLLILLDISFLSGEVLHDISLHLLLEHGDFLNTDISQGSVATWSKRGGIFKHDYCTFAAESNSEGLFKNSILLNSIPFYCRSIHSDYTEHVDEIAIR